MQQCTNKKFWLLMSMALLLSGGQATAQESSTIDFSDSIQYYDISNVVTVDSFLAENDEDSQSMIKRMEPIGFIGDNFQRFYIHFTQVQKQKGKPNEYALSGKTKVKSIISDFKGTITVTSARLLVEGDFPKYKQGWAIGDVILYEDKKQTSSGCIKGKLKTYFIIDDKGRFRYDALAFSADGFSNNEVEGTWTSYRTNKTKVCNWGDYRIPNSSDLDTGAGEFSVDEKYINKGWVTYKLAWNGDPDKPETLNAQKLELEKWWQ
jgi:hypothetical protein